MISMNEADRVGLACAAPSASTDIPQRPEGRGRKNHQLKRELTAEDLQKHFGTIEPKEIAAQIIRIGQRDLQQKFSDVYGAPTFSNNNNWLRRKLMEAARCMHFYKPQTKYHLLGKQNPTKAIGSHPRAMPTVGGVRGGPLVSKTPASSSSSANASNYRIQATARELHIEPWNLEPICLNGNMLADARDGCDSSGASRSGERPQDCTEVSSTFDAQWANNFRFVLTSSGSLPRYEALELLAEDERSPTTGEPADVAHPHLRDCNLGSGIDTSLDISLYTHPRIPHGAWDEPLLMSDMHPAPLPTAVAALEHAPIQEHTGLECWSSYAQNSGESNVVIGGRHDRESELGVDLHAYLEGRTLRSESITSGVDALLDMQSPFHCDTAEQEDNTSWELAALHSQLSADHSHGSPFGMFSERLDFAAPCVPTMAAQRAFNQMEPCCHMDADLTDADLMGQSLEFLQPSEALYIIEQEISAVNAKQQLLSMYYLV